MIIEFNQDFTDENEKRKIEAKMTNVDEKVQALGKFFTSNYQRGKIKTFFSFQVP
jgi:hypothetical protein